jgi:hypothetical protein
MAFGQTSGPPASAKQVKYLESLLHKAGHTSFRDARHPLGLTQRQAGGKFTTKEASELIDLLLNGEPADVGASVNGFTSRDSEIDERETIARGMPAGILAGELERRGWVCTPPN